jgi:phosphoglycolate phosphatase-like HAD superfamily hydrolase
MGKPIYIFDLDGVLACHRHRLCHISVKVIDYEKFYRECIHDSPIQNVIRTFQRLRKSGAEMWIWTGRSDMVAEETIMWLKINGCSPHQLRMRSNGDHKKGWELKKQWLDSLPMDKYKRIAAVFEDRMRVVDMWRYHGITCFQNVNGEY